MAKVKVGTHGLKQTEGLFELAGLVVLGDLKESSEKTEYKFGIKTNETNTPYVKSGKKAQQAVYFYSKDAKESKKVSFADRNSFSQEGFQKIGNNVGINKDSEGNNVKEIIFEYDTPKYLDSNLKENQSVFVRGDLNFYSFMKDDGEKVNMKELIVKDIYASSKPIKFDSDDFVEKNAFVQKIVYDNVEKNEDGTFELFAYIVNYNSIERVAFKIEDSNLAKILKKNLKSGNAIDVSGIIKNELVQVEADKSDKGVWGEENPLKRATSTKRTFLVRGAMPDTIDIETYSIDIIKEKIKELNSAKESFGQTKKDKEVWGENSFDNKKNVIEDDSDSDSDDFPF